MKTIFTAITLIILSTLISYSQIDSTKIAFVSYWYVGESYDFKITKIKEKWKEEEMSEKKESSYLANFTVIDSTESSYTTKWSYENDLRSDYEIPVELIASFRQLPYRPYLIY